MSDLEKNYRMYLQDVEASARACVEQGKGVWVGIQECEGHYYELALFNSPKTGSTLAIKTTEITPELVAEKIAASDKLFTKQRSTILRMEAK